MSYPVVVLKAGREIPLLAGHPWIFSRGIERAEQTQPGSIVEVRSWKGDFFGLGTYHPSTTIRIRLLTRNLEPIDTEFFFERFIRLRSEKERFLPPHTDGFRLVHADGDGLPGLIVDVYGEVAVFQIHTAGMEPFRELVVEALFRLPGIGAVVERSDVEARRAEGLSILNTRVHRGNIDGPVPFREAGLALLADVRKGRNDSI
jgi:23S rRNA (cytosine1962-C5)-methyltransferase